MGWCDDVKSKKFYNRLIKLKKKLGTKNYLEMILSTIYLFPYRIIQIQ